MTHHLGLRQLLAPGVVGAQELVSPFKTTDAILRFQCVKKEARVRVRVDERLSKHTCTSASWMAGVPVAHVSAKMGCRYERDRNS